MVHLRCFEQLNEQLFSLFLPEMDGFFQRKLCSQLQTTDLGRSNLLTVNKWSSNPPF
uniref:Uncharacterized protein n=1 Tax=Rhizophora mucronata TaxID=61149 RepID=A0A2P2P6H2_RHIMU